MHIAVNGSEVRATCGTHRKKRVKNVDGKVQGRSKRAILFIRGLRESLRQGSARKAVV